LTFWPGFNPVTVAVALFLFFDALALGTTFAVAGTFAAAAFAVVATFAATVAFTAALVAAAVFPPPTTNTRADVAPAGTCQSQLPTVENVRTVSPFERDVEVGTQAAAFAGTGIETNNPEIKVAITVETIFGRAALTLMRTTSNFTFTSLLALSWGEVTKVRRG
jgi:hypothetical protein